MPYIKKLVMHGFKSFARRTEIPFENSMNVIVGPNGSGKSNITDALCFVLGRISIKSIRAAKAANLLFSGNKNYKSANEAIVELVFDNSDKAFAVDSLDVSIKRIVRRNGLSIYKINNETKTRQELIEMLAQAGIDPNGFNIVLQGEIASLVKARPEERRKIIEEVAGISIYETRKQKSIRELEKTDEKLKEVSAVLRERQAYLKNLDKERQEALNYKKLEETIKKCKATILEKGIKEKESDIWGVEKIIENNKKEIEKIKKVIIEKNADINVLQEKINRINKTLQSSTGSEQEILHKEIAELRAALAGLTVRKENFEARISEASGKEEDFKWKIKELEKDVSEIKTSSPEIKKQQSEQKEIQERFDVLEKQRRKYYVLKSELATVENKRSEKERFLIESKKEIELIDKSITSLFEEIKYAKSSEKAEVMKKELKEELEKARTKIEELQKTDLENERRNAVFTEEIKREERLKQDISKIDICPLCRSEMTKEHVGHVIENANKKIENAKKEIEKSNNAKQEAAERISKIKLKLSEFETKLNEINIDIFKIRNADERKNQIKRISKQQEDVKKEMDEFDLKIKTLRPEFEKLKNVEEKYDETRMKLQEFSFADVDVDTEMTIKQRELSRIKMEIKSVLRDSETSNEELKKINEQLNEKVKIVNKKEIEEQQLYERFQKFFNERNEFQDQEKAFETEVIGLQHTIRNFEEKINQVNIQKAQLNAQIDSLKTEFAEFSSMEILNMPIEKVKERLQASQMRISQLGNINMRALEVFDTVLEQCKLIEDKMITIQDEKGKIMKIIDEIDKKKRKSFTKTLDSVNEYFTRNFTQLSKKGEVFLEPENVKEPFNGGLNIILKVARGKYFDVSSLSGGEKTLVALSLIFAIQEYNPYCFYVFDEIDAALDKHNSERLAALIKQYMTSGQYIVVTHNDALISESSALYGVSMQENISKVISLKI